MFFGKRPRTVQRPKGGVPQAPKNTKKKALRKTALLLVSFQTELNRIKKQTIKYLIICFVPGTGLEPAHPCGHWSLKPARLPIPPSGRYFWVWECKCNKFNYFSRIFLEKEDKQLRSKHSQKHSKRIYSCITHCREIISGSCVRVCKCGGICCAACHQTHQSKIVKLKVPP